MAISGLVCLALGISSLEEQGGIGQVLKEMCQDGLQGLCGEAERPGHLSLDEVEAQGNTGAPCNCVKGNFRDDDVFLGSGRIGKPPQSAAWKVQTGGEEKEITVKG